MHSQYYIINKKRGEVKITSPCENYLMLDCHFFIFLIIAPILSCSGLGTCCWRILISEYTNSNSFWMPILFERSWCFAASKLTLSQEYSSWLLITSSFSSTLFNSELILSTSVLIRRLQFSKFFLKSAVCWMISLTSKLSPFCLLTSKGNSL